MDTKSDKIIVSDQSLNQYFFTHLSDVNKRFHCPLPEEFILYSSELMQKYALSENFYSREQDCGTPNILGMQLLKAKEKSITEQKELYLDIGDQVLFQLGVFPDGITKKTPSRKYYLNIGKSAYSKAASLECSFYDIPNFYNLLATSLENLIKLIAHVSLRFSHASVEQYLLDHPAALANMGINKRDKAS